MSYRKAKTSLELNTRPSIGAIATLLINVMLYLMVDALLTVNLSLPAGGLAS